MPEVSYVITWPINLLTSTRKQPSGLFMFPLNIAGALLKNVETLRNLEKMILAAVKTTSFERLSTTKNEIEELRNTHQNDQCLSEFFKRTKGIDEKSRWSF